MTVAGSLNRGEFTAAKRRHRHDAAAFASRLEAAACRGRRGDAGHLRVELSDNALGMTGDQSSVVLSAAERAMVRRLIGEVNDFNVDHHHRRQPRGAGSA
jgi:hypothetical protein